MSVLACPRCGAPIAAPPSLRGIVVCEHCRAFVLVDHTHRAVAVGQGVPLRARRTPLALGRLVEHASGLSARVVGRARYGYEDGEWDEWIAVTGAPPGGAVGLVRISEDEGDLVLWSGLEVRPPGSLSAARPGARVPLSGISVVVAELGEARLLGAEGWLDRPELVEPRFAYVDGHADGGLVSLRAHASSLVVLRGRPIEDLRVTEAPG